MDVATTFKTVPKRGSTSIKGHFFKSFKLPNRTVNSKI